MREASEGLSPAQRTDLEKRISDSIALWAGVQDIDESMSVRALVHGSFQHLQLIIDRLGVLFNHEEICSPHVLEKLLDGRKTIGFMIRCLVEHGDNLVRNGKTKLVALPLFTEENS